MEMKSEEVSGKSMEKEPSGILIENNKIRIRTMGQEDILPLMQGAGDLSDSFRDYLQTHLERQETGGCRALVAYWDGKAAGHVFLYYKCRWGACKELDLPGIVDLEVFEACRNKGVGSALMDAAEGAAKVAVQASGDSRQICLEVCLDSSYGPAQRLYAKRGYIPDGKGVYYEGEVCRENASIVNNDELTLCLVKDLK